MAAITGVHGIGQQQLGRTQLVLNWAPALRDGIERACGHPSGEPPLDIAFYGDIFLPPAGADPRTKSSRADAESWWEELDGDELADLLDAVAEVLPSDAVEAAERAPVKARTRVPGALRALDRHFGPSSGLLYLGELRQVRRYLTDWKLKAKVDAAVRAAITPDCRVVIGHSLGSVVAFEYVRQNPSRRLDQLVTLGSPLGLRIVRRLMAAPDHGAADGLPMNVATWANIRDPHDPVACAGPLSRWWPGVDDRPLVDNGDDAHSATRYLGKRETGRVLLDALPELGQPPR